MGRPNPDRYRLNVALKIAIMGHSITQRSFAQHVGISEIRISELVRGRGAPASADEKRRIARHLRQSIASLFPTRPAADPIEAR